MLCLLTDGLALVYHKEMVHKWVLNEYSLWKSSINTNIIEISEFIKLLGSFYVMNQGYCLVGCPSHFLPEFHSLNKSGSQICLCIETTQRGSKTTDSYVPLLEIVI